MAIDLEHFPTNETALRMMERISPIYDRSYVGKWIFEIMGMEMGEAAPISRSCAGNPSRSGPLGPSNIGSEDTLSLQSPPMTWKPDGGISS